MKEIQITPPEGYEIDQEKSTFSKIVFKAINTKFPKWEDLKELEGFYIDGSSHVSSIKTHTVRPGDRNILPTNELAEAMIALCQLLYLRNLVWNGWKPDYCDDNRKYIIFQRKGMIYDGVTIYLNRILMFPTREVRDKFLESYRDLIEQAKELL